MIKTGHKYRYKPSIGMDIVGWIDGAKDKDIELTGCMVLVTKKHLHKGIFTGKFLTGKYVNEIFNFHESCLVSTSFISNYVTTRARNTPNVKEK